MPCAAPLGRDGSLPGTLANFDDTPYVVPIPETATRDFIVEARVRYQSASREGTSLGDPTTCATDACPLTPPPPGEASNVLAGAAPLLVARDAATGLLTFTHAPACDAVDHALISGPLSAVSTYPHDGIACGQGVSGTFTLDPGAGSQYFLVIGRSLAAEGSYGRDSLGVERPQRVGVTPCDEPQDLSATCG